MVCHAYEDHRGWNLDSLERAFRYYALADSIFVRNGWTESSSVLHYNMGEINMDAGLHDPAWADTIRQPDGQGRRWRS